MLSEPPQAEKVAQALASVVGMEGGLLYTSTLHLFWDVLGILTKEPTLLLWDAGVYPVVRWAIERAAARGVPAWSFGHCDVHALEKIAWEQFVLARGPIRRKLVVVSDGYCPGCGRLAPLAGYLAVVRKYGGYLLIDDTQSLGILGSRSRGTPYGRGGGGAYLFCGLSGPELLSGSSLAKAFGVPIAVLTGEAKLVSRIAQEGETRVHCSPPCAAVIRGAENALLVNAEQGDDLRQALAQRVRFFRSRLMRAGIRTTGGLHPVQGLRLQDDARSRALLLYETLLEKGIHTVLQRPTCSDLVRVALLIRASHTKAELEEVVETILSWNAKINVR